MERLCILLRTLGRITRIAKYRCWLFFGGDHTEDGFRFLSASIIANRILIEELRSQIRELRRRVVELEEKG